jgi:hypothetical protein
MDAEAQDEMWTRLVSAGHVDEVPGAVRDRAWTNLQRRIETAQAPRRTRWSLRFAAIGTAAAVAALAVWTVNLGGGTTPSADAPAQSTAPSEPTVTPGDTSQGRWVIKRRNQPGALALPYFLPSISAFAGDPFVSRVVIGTVETTSVEVRSPGSEVVTEITILPSKEMEDASVLHAVETGGDIPASEVRAEIESKIGRPLRPEELKHIVSYQIDGRRSVQRGDTVLVFLGSASDASPDIPVVGRMNLSSDGTRWSWAGLSPNPTWQTSMSFREGLELVQ